MMIAFAFLSSLILFFFSKSAMVKDSPQSSMIQAYESFLLDVQFWHTFQPSTQLSLTAKMANADLFPNAYNLLHDSQSDNTQNTLLAFNTPTGSYPIPSHLPAPNTNPIMIHQLSLNLHLQQLQYSYAPYTAWFQIETEAGHLHFPSTPTVNFSQLPPIQNEQIQPVNLPPLPNQVNFHARRPNQQTNYQQQLPEIREVQLELQYR